jgi:hypothetical protein
LRDRHLAQHPHDEDQDETRHQIRQHGSRPHGVYHRAAPDEEAAPMIPPREIIVM